MEVFQTDLFIQLKKGSLEQIAFFSWSSSNGQMRRKNDKWKSQISANCVTAVELVTISDFSNMLLYMGAMKILQS